MNDKCGCEKGASCETPKLEAAKPAAPENLLDFSEFMRADLRVAVIEAAEAVPKSKKLIKIQLSLGAQLGKRQVVAGIGQFYEAPSLVGLKVIVVANLKPAVLMGQESQGMILAGVSEDQSTLRILQPHPDLPPGSVVR